MQRPSIVVAVLASCLSSLGAQEVSPPARAPFNASLICAQTDSLHLGRVVLEPPATGVTLGPVLSCGENGITFGAFAGQDRQTVAPSSIRQLWVRRGSGLGGAIWVGIGGGLLGYAIASAGTHQCPNATSTADNSLNCHGNIPVGVALGAVAGVGIGWFFGRGIPRWKAIYRAGP